jgi:fumarylacetoacetate (FAA) hydrolase
MKLASLKEGGRDGCLIVVSRDLARGLRVSDIAATLQQALDNWAEVEPKLRTASGQLNRGPLAGAFEFDPSHCAAPLPRAYQWADGSAYVNHVDLVRRARGATLPESFWTEPLIYQGGSDNLLGPCDPIEAVDEAHGIDFEAEVAVITGDVPMAAPPGVASGHIRLLTLVNDVSLRNLIPGELAKGFGFFQSKPASAFSAIAATPDELGSDWHDNKLHRPVEVQLNGKPFGRPDAGLDMTFDFAQLIAHAARTRRLAAGSIVGSGTISNRENGGPGRPVAEGGIGYACIAEQRSVETILHGAPATAFLKFGDRVRIEMRDKAGASIFGAIDQQVVRPVLRGPGR